MPYDLFWKGSLNAFFYYIKKHSLEQKDKAEFTDTMNWEQGNYVKQALQSVYKLFNWSADGKAIDYPYPNKPYHLLAEEQEERRKKQEKFDEINREISEHNKSIDEMMRNKKIR